MKKKGILFTLISIFTSISFSNPINTLNFVGKIQCFNPKTKKLDAEFVILTTNNFSYSERNKSNLASLLEKYNKNYWLTQTYTGNCSLQDTLNVYIKKPTDALELLNTLIKIFNFKYIINGNLNYKTSLLAINENNLSLQDLLNLIVNTYIKQSNPDLNITFDIKKRKIFIDLKSLKEKKKKKKTKYNLLSSKTSNFISRVLYLRGISANEFIRKLEIRFGNEIVYTVDPLFNAVVITGPQNLINQILKDYRFFIRKSNLNDRLLTKIFYIKFGQSKEILERIKKYLSKNGFVQYLADANAIEITDYPTNLSIIEKVFGEFLSQRPIKIKVIAKFVRINKTFARSLGINWDFTYGSNSAAKSIASWQVTQNQGSLTSQVQFLYKKFNPINLTISAGESVGLSRVLSSPSLVLLPNQTGNISFGTQIPYQSVDQNGNPKTELVAATLTLNVTPQLLPDGRILLKLNLSNNSPNTALSVNGQPAIDTFTITQNFVVANGDTIIIGGVLQKKKDQGENGVPILRKIPLLGWLFKNKNWTNTDNELYIVISAQIVTQ